jgi:hypothetical protein
VIIWFAALIPFIGAGALFWIWNRKVALWEGLVMMVVPLFLIGGAKACSEHSQTAATEYWGGYVTTAEYYEDWDERVSCRHPISCIHPTYSVDSNGRPYQSGYAHSNDGHYHSYDVDYHPEEWEVHTSVKESRSISKLSFEGLAKQFSSRDFVNLHRSYHSKNGNKYVATWKGEAETLEPVTVSRSYENRVQASQSVFNFKTVDPKDYGLYKHPPVSGFSQQVTHGPSATALAEKKFQYLNATLGAPKQVRLYVLVFQNQPIQAAMEQEAFWKRGNKNEFVTCIGVDKDLEVQWSHVFSWSEIEELKIEARNQVMGMKKLDLVAYADWLGPMIEKKWVRKNFDDFSYLTVEPTTSAVIWTFLLTLLVTAAIGVFAVLNDVDNDGTFLGSHTYEFGRRWR